MTGALADEDMADLLAHYGIDAFMFDVSGDPEDSAPGLDGLPYKAWKRHPYGVQILDSVVWWMLNGNMMLPSF